MILSSIVLPYRISYGNKNISDLLSLSLDSDGKFLINVLVYPVVSYCEKSIWYNDLAPSSLFRPVPVDGLLEKIPSLTILLFMSRPSFTSTYKTRYAQ